MNINEDEKLKELFEGISDSIPGETEKRAITYKDFKEVVDHTIKFSYKTGLTEGIKKAEGMVQNILDKCDSE